MADEIVLKIFDTALKELEEQNLRCVTAGDKFLWDNLKNKPLAELKVDGALRAMFFKSTGELLGRTSFGLTEHPVKGSKLIDSGASDANPSGDNLNTHATRSFWVPAVDKLTALIKSA